MHLEKIGLKLTHLPLLSLELQKKKSDVKSKTKRRKYVGGKIKRQKPVTLEANTKTASKSKS